MATATLPVQVVTVTWMNGQQQIYTDVRKWECQDGQLWLTVESGAWIIPLANVQIWRLT